MSENVFSTLPDDIVLNIFNKLEDDPRNWSRVACVSTKFSSLIRTVCWKTKCYQTIPSLLSDLLQTTTTSSAVAPPGGWASLHKLAVCCPGLVHSGVLLENSDFGLERELGPDENYQETKLFQLGQSQSQSIPSSSNTVDNNVEQISQIIVSAAPDCSWSLYDDLYFDTVYNDIKSQDNKPGFCEEEPPQAQAAAAVVKPACDFTVCKRRKVCRSLRSHLASGVWNLSREQGNKLLASRFRADCLYICDWPGCLHTEEKRNYMLFRGIFKNFKKSRVWRTINDGNRSKIDLNCAYCPSKQIWDLHSAFCLRPAYGFHDDGEPVVRAYVCENGHVSGAWTDWPLYT